jgi:hypothetical protein
VIEVMLLVDGWLICMYDLFGISRCWVVLVGPFGISICWLDCFGFIGLVKFVGGVYDA